CLRVEAAEIRDDVSGELADGGVVLLRRLVVALTFDRDAILRSFELRLKLEEILIRFQVGITLDDDEESRQRIRESGLRLFELRHRRRISRRIRRGATRTA